MKRYIAILLAFALVLSMAACTQTPTSTPDPTPSAEPTAEPTPSPEPSAEPSDEPVDETPEPSDEPVTEPDAEIRDFFSGEVLEEQDYTRPFAIMINNLKEALPQMGISQADIIYEILAEGGVTRMMAIFSDLEDVGVIGSMRSIRPYYVDVAMAYGAVAIHAGYSEAAIERIDTYGVDHICGVTSSDASKTFYRDGNRMAYGVEHSLFTTGSRLLESAERHGFDLSIGQDYENGLNFVSEATPENGEAADSISIYFNTFKYTNLKYHSDTDLYTAVQHGVNYIDGDTNASVTFKNIIVIYADLEVVDSYGRLAIDLISSGDGYFACGGKYIPITWERESAEDCFHYYLADGSELNIEEGTTYVAVIPPTGSSISFN